VNQNTGVASVLGAGTCVIDVEISQNGRWLATSARASFTIAQAQQSAIEIAEVVGGQTSSFSFQTLRSGVRLFQKTIDFGVPLRMSINGGTISESGVIFTAIGEGCVVIGDTLFPGSVKRSQGAAGLACRINATKLGDANYLPVSSTLDVTVVPAAQQPLMISSPTTVNFGDKIRLFTSGGSGTGAVEYSILSGRDFCSIQQQTVTVSGEVQYWLLGDAAGECAIGASKRATNDFFAINSPTSGTGSYTVNVAKIPQVVKFTSNVPTFPSSGSEYVPVAVSVNGLDLVSGTSLSPDIRIATWSAATTASGEVCAISSGKITFGGPGICEIEAVHNGSANFLPAPVVKQIILVGTLNQSISIVRPADRVYGDPAFMLSGLATSGLPVTYSRGENADTASCTVTSDGLVEIGDAGICEIKADQAGNGRYAAAPAAYTRFTVIPRSAGAPFITSVAANNESITVTFREPSYKGGSAIRGYRIIATPTGSLDDASSSPEVM
jgi:hypothetical protein